MQFGFLALDPRRQEAYPYLISNLLSLNRRVPLGPMKNNQHILIIGYVWPEPDSSAAGRRMMQLISLFQLAGWNVTFASASAETEHMIDLSDRGIETADIEINSSRFDEFIRDLQPSVVMFDRFVIEEQFGWRVAEHCPDAVRLLDTEDLHCLRKARHMAVKEGRDFKMADLLATNIAKREIASILRCDLSLIISEFEMHLLQEVFGIESRHLHYLPFLLDSIEEDKIRHWNTFESRHHFVMIGNFRHAPNWDAVLYMKNDIWPRIRRKLPKTQLHIYGAYPSRKVKELHSPKDGFLIQGRAEEARTVVGNARLCLAPLRFGAGLKGKLVEAMQCGTPSVTTGIGAEGINGTIAWSGKIADEAAKISEAAVKLYSEKSVWESAQKRGIRIINERFAKAGFEATLITQIEQLQAHLEAHRLQNFTGRMLMHHTMASTKYMSRWIEAKNS